MPKKLNSSLLSDSRQNAVNLAWGLHIIEEPNKLVLSFILLVFVILSFIVSVVWDFAKTTEETGFAIGQWMVAVLSAILGLVYVHVTDNVRDA
jgi:hypothetical protein